MSLALKELEETVDPLFAKAQRDFEKTDETRYDQYLNVIALTDEVNALAMRAQRQVRRHNESALESRCSDVDRVLGVVDSQLSVLEVITKRAHQLDDELTLLLGRSYY
ncbi:Hypothetical protein, putative [Bodo saltans]|uniref:Uncharacterized protein n=1 Tax=Bodo saltans TaxID=75058 RepID=A0A0S4IV56_BODSA|nr:Hypothetical protein, putative [Bodo saltans]|eukprot:CUF50713.1 Hypothetical protein, putative [Bodo saltans]